MRALYYYLMFQEITTNDYRTCSEAYRSPTSQLVREGGGKEICTHRSLCTGRKVYFLVNGRECQCGGGIKAGAEWMWS